MGKAGQAGHHARVAVRVKVRCLGPGKEHTFMTSDPKAERICRACRAKLDQQRVSETIVVRDVRFE